MMVGMVAGTGEGAVIGQLSHWSGNPAVDLHEVAGFRHMGERWGEEPVMVLGPA